MPREHPTTLALVAVGGALGSLARWGISEWLPHQGFAWQTFTVNVLGAGLIGLLFGATTSAHRHTRVLFGTGFLGGFTTFSTWMADAHRNAADGQWWLGFVYLASTLVAGLACTVAGLWLGRQWFDRRLGIDRERAA